MVILWICQISYICENHIYLFQIENGFHQPFICIQLKGNIFLNLREAIDKNVWVLSNAPDQTNEFLKGPKFAFDAVCGGTPLSFLHGFISEMRKSLKLNALVED